MPRRKPTVAGTFYPNDAAECRREIDIYADAAEVFDLPRPAVAGLVPHAGWIYSGQTAMHVMMTLRDGVSPETVVLFGAVHTWGVTQASVYGQGSWASPLGDAAVDKELARALIANCDVVVDRPEAHLREHSIEVQIPMVQRLFAGARILPIAVPPSEQAATVGRAAARAARGLERVVIALASSDLTHYGPRYGYAPAGGGQAGLEWAYQNDLELLEAAERMDADGMLAHAAARRSACGAGAISAAIAFAMELGASQGMILKKTTSYDVMPLGDPTDFVGYGGAVWM